jgi:hypothetical protein
VDVARRRVEHDVGVLAHRGEHLALAPDAVDERAVALQRMRAADGTRLMPCWAPAQIRRFIQSMKPVISCPSLA